MNTIARIIESKINGPFTIIWMTDLNDVISYHPCRDLDDYLNQPESVLSNVENIKIEGRQLIDEILSLYIKTYHDYSNIEGDIICLDLESWVSFEQLTFESDDCWEKCLEIIEKTDTKLLINLSGHLRLNCFGYVFQLAKKYNIDMNNVIISIPWVDNYKEQLDNIMSELVNNNINDEKTCIPELIVYPMWQSLIQDLAFILQDYHKENRILQIKKYKYKYLCMIGRTHDMPYNSRYHKAALFHYLQSSDLIDKGIVTANNKKELRLSIIKYLYDKDSHRVIYQKLIEEDFKTSEHLVSTLKSNIDNFQVSKDLIELSSDSKWLLEYNKSGERDIPWADPKLIPYYESVYFEVLSEHFFFEYSSNEQKYFKDENLITEKMFRPMAFKVPFIVFARPRILSVLRNAGFRTFDGIIDESYDTIEDDCKRFEMIVLEIERLCNLNDEELNEFLTKAKEICDYNYQVLLDSDFGIRKPD